MSQSQGTASSSLRKVELYTDGACSGNPGPGGWAFILRDVKTKKELTGSGGERDCYGAVMAHERDRFELQIAREWATFPVVTGTDIEEER